MNELAAEGAFSPAHGSSSIPLVPAVGALKQSGFARNVEDLTTQGKNSYARDKKNGAYNCYVDKFQG